MYNSNKVFSNKIFKQFSNDLDFLPNALSGFAGVAIGTLIAHWVGII